MHRSNERGHLSEEIYSEWYSWWCVMTKDKSLFWKAKTCWTTINTARERKRSCLFTNVGRNSIQTSLSSSIIRIRNEDKFEQEIIAWKVMNKSSNDRFDWYKNTANSDWNRHYCCCYCCCSYLNHDWYSMNCQHLDCIGYWYSCSAKDYYYYCCWALIDRGSYYCLHTDWNLHRRDCCWLDSDWDWRNLCSLNLDCCSSLENPFEDLMENTWKNQVILERRRRRVQRMNKEKFYTCW